MKRIRIGVLGPSDIAFRRTVPAIVKNNLFIFVGLAHASKKEWGTEAVDDSVISKEILKCDRFVRAFGGKIFDSYFSLLKDPSIDAVYIPLPPSLHKKWAMIAIENGKHVILEKPFTTSYIDTMEIIEAAKKRGLIVHENYAFMYHNQIKELDRIVCDGVLGELRFIRSSFSFPYRGEQDFRYHKKLGGGAVIDCAGYPIKMALHFLGDSFQRIDSVLFSSKEHDVDVYGSACFKNDTVVAQVFWGMDNAYRCNLELFGSKGFASAQRVYSPTAEMNTQVLVNIEGKEKNIDVGPDDQFDKSITFFANCVNGKVIVDYESILKQAKIIDDILDKSL